MDGVFSNLRVTPGIVSTSHDREEGRGYLKWRFGQTCGDWVKFDPNEVLGRP